MTESSSSMIPLPPSSTSSSSSVAAASASYPCTLVIRLCVCAYVLLSLLAMGSLFHPGDGIKNRNGSHGLMRSSYSTQRQDEQRQQQQHQHQSKHHDRSSQARGFVDEPVDDNVQLLNQESNQGVLESDKNDSQVAYETSSINTTTTTISKTDRTSKFPLPSNDPYYSKLVQQGSTRSSQHQRKFLARKHRIASQFAKRLRYQSPVGDFAAIVLSKTFAFLHIWKCGGTTVAGQTPEIQHSLDTNEIQTKQWVAFVRDPIDRFLSAWAECGDRRYRGEDNFAGLDDHTTLNWLNDSYDFRIRAFLHEVQDFIFPDVMMSCHTHAHPQVNFMINEKTGHIDEHISLVGDLSELKGVLNMVGFQSFSEKVKGRDSNANVIKKEYFPSRRELLHDQTILELCEFLAMDYFLLDFDPPSICVQPGGPLARFI